MPERARHQIHLISDSTGETLHAMARAALALFASDEVTIHISVFVRSDRDLELALKTATEHPGLILYTVIDEDHRAEIERTAGALGVVAHSALDAVVATLAAYLGRPPEQRAGRQHRMTAEYFNRINALDYAIANDDGALGQRLLRADVVLTGVSRTSKTPTCIYLAYRGIKAANVPLVPRRAPDPGFFAALEAGIPVVGLTASPTRLAQIRTQRLEALGADASPDYAEIDKIRDEVADARLFFQRHGIPVIDVTRRSIEETAAEVQALLRAREEARP